MFLLRILIITIIIGAVIWVINRALGNPPNPTKIAIISIMIVALVYLLLGGLSYLVESI